MTLICSLNHKFRQWPAKDNALKFSPDCELWLKWQIVWQISFEYINRLNDWWMGVQDGDTQTSMNEEKGYEREGQGEMWGDIELLPSLCCDRGWKQWDYLSVKPSGLSNKQRSKQRMSDRNSTSGPVTQKCVDKRGKEWHDMLLLILWILRTLTGFTDSKCLA